ncbi:hypothetical protein RB620_15265 [Paenibacillus sp. LHD-117]|uniref:hypothetical protein n=1 Tax=Paenibacillus sp. LHD-117 TaxID=3071412 RepID=UPI0027E15DB3|nr:hypothetical protein [Paenibacillus sp. LHD-117]MDQ6420788.1 hypothetical protein [Paenibacillus sp. LHD-117]
MNFRMIVLLLVLMIVTLGCTNEKDDSKRLKTGVEKVIRLRDVESYFKKSLEVELGAGSSDIAKFWDVFKTFSKEEVGDDGRNVESGLLYECGFTDMTGFKLGKERFFVNFVRQFSVYEDNGEYSHMEQLVSHFVFEPTDEISELESDALWFFFDEGGELEEYFAEIENQESFKAALKNKPIQFEIYQTEI